jgi:hypothetical protein
MKFAGGNDSIDIIIYVVIMVVGLIASAFRNANKRKAIENQQPGEVIPRFPEVEFEPVFEYERPEIRELVPEEDVLPKSELETISEETSLIDTQPVLEEVESTNDTILTDAPVKEGQAAFESTARIMMPDSFQDLGISLTEGQPTDRGILDGEIGGEQEVELEAELNLEEAVIYSEILRQKYFSNSY